MAGCLALVSPTTGLVRGALGAGPATAEDMRAEIERGIAESLPPPFEQAGEIGVSERDGAFHIVIPGVKMARQGNGSLAVGDVEVVAVPLPDGGYRIAVTLPEEMSLRDETDANAGTVVIGAQRFEGAWSPEFDALLHIDANYDDIRVIGPGEQLSTRIGTLVLKGATVETAPGAWKSLSIIRLGDVEFSGEEGNGRVTLGAVELRTDVEDMRLEEQLRFSHEISGALQHDLEKTDEGKPDPLALLRVLESMPRLFGSLTMDVTVAGIEIRNEDGQAIFGLDRLSYGLALNGLEGEQSSVGLRYEHDGLELAMLGAAPAEVVPAHVAVDLAATRLPNGALWQAWRDWARAASTSPDEAIEGRIADRLVAAVLDATSQLEIRRLEIEAPGFSVEANGEIRADRAAAYKGVAELDAAIHGLDNLVRSMSMMSEDDEDAAQAAGVLAFVQMLGAEEHDESGAPYRRYRVHVPADGTVTLNGADLGALFKALDTE